MCNVRFFSPSIPIVLKESQCELLFINDLVPWIATHILKGIITGQHWLLVRSLFPRGLLSYLTLKHSVICCISLYRAFHNESVLTGRLTQQGLSLSLPTSPLTKRAVTLCFQIGSFVRTCFRSYSWNYLCWFCMCLSAWILLLY